MQRQLSDTERAEVQKRADERWKKRVEFERLRKYAPASILEATSKISAPASAPVVPTTKGADAPRENVMNDKVIVKTLSELQDVLKQGAIQKKMRVFMPGNGPDGLIEVDLDAAENLLGRMAGTGSEQMFSPGKGADARFPSESSIVDRPVNEDDDSLMPQKTYDVLFPGYTRVGPSAFLNPNADPNIARPEPFRPSEPGRLSTNPGGDALDPREDQADLTGSTYSRSTPVFKGLGKKVAKGTFAGTAADMGTIQEHERHTGRGGK